MYQLDLLSLEVEVYVNSNRNKCVAPEQRFVVFKIKRHKYQGIHNFLFAVGNRPWYWLKDKFWPCGKNCVYQGPPKF